MSEIRTILATDCGSTTTKAILIEKQGDEYRLVVRGEAPTTVEAPFDDVTVGVLNAVREVEELSGRRILTGGDAKPTPLAPLPMREGGTPPSPKIGSPEIIGIPTPQGIGKGPRGVPMGRDARQVGADSDSSEIGKGQSRCIGTLRLCSREFIRMGIKMRSPCRWKSYSSLRFSGML